MGFYDEMQDVATELLSEFKQGVVQLIRVTPGAPDPATPWEPGPPTQATYDLKATVTREHQRYENGVLIVETGDMVMFAVPEVTPLLSDKLVIDGAVRSITNLTPIPAAGDPVAWKAWCAG
ncbi:hypothetical protein [Kaistia sp. MMO-174]|uniref:hypothetical protein n=1 Tax=Kaistia sp. MMO-174 TaxID=3081256 RepID=UPI00301A087B